MTMLHDQLEQQVLAGVIAAPARHAQTALNRLENADFTDWRNRHIFEALGHCEFAGHQEPGSILIQVNAWLLDHGHYADRDDGLRATVTALAEVRGHPEQLDLLVRELLDARFRRAVTEYAAALAEHAEHSPLHDITEHLNTSIKELRELWARLHPTTLTAVTEKGVA